MAGTSATSAVLFLRQSAALLRKNLLIRARSWRLNLFHAFQAVAVIFLVWAINEAVSYSNSQFTGAKAVTSPDAQDIPPIPDCRNDLFLLDDSPCLAFIYTPGGHPLAEELVAAIRQGNSPQIPPDQVLGLQDMNETDEYLWAHPQTVLAAFHLTIENGQPLSYVLQSNVSSVYFKGTFQDPNLYVQLPLQAALERAVGVRQMQAYGPAAAAPVSWSVRIKNFPHPSLTVDSIAGRVAPVFILASLMMNFVVLLSGLVAEKENGVRAAMSTMGMMDGAYWLSWLLPELFLGALHASLITATARAFQFQLVINNDLVLMLLLVLLTNTALMAFAVVVSTFIKKSATAVPLSFALFIVAWVLQLVVYFGFPYNSTSMAGRILTYAFSFFPWCLLSKGTLDLADATTGSWQQGITWSTQSSYCWPGTPPPSVTDQQQYYYQANCHLPLGQIYWVLCVQAAGYLVLALYLDKVLPGGDQAPAPQPWYFLLTRSFWFPKKTQDLRYMREALLSAVPPTQQQGQQQQPSEGEPLEDEDVACEAQAVRRLCQACCDEGSGGAAPAAAAAAAAGSFPLAPQSAPPAGGLGAAAIGLHLFGLRKVYGGGRAASSASWVRAVFSRRRRAAGSDGSADAAGAEGVSRPAVARVKEEPGGHVAVAGTWLSIPEGQCFCLLGPNGAGKTTSIKCLIGALKPSGGDALVYGHSIRNPRGMAAARAMSGVCPQFDVLWGELSAHEHMMLYADIKGLPWASRAAMAAQLLDKVALSPAAHTRTAAFSGGMRRRLSVAVALLGDPKVLYLDEPTTGMDPVSRRQVWDLLDAAKRERVVVLTTHSMEEADVLGDRIGIIAGGRMRCLGSSMRLKTRFGSGYRVSVPLAAAPPASRAAAAPQPAARGLKQQNGAGDGGGDSAEGPSEISGNGGGGSGGENEQSSGGAEDTRIPLYPPGIGRELAAAVVRYLGPAVLSTSASVDAASGEKMLLGVQPLQGEGGGGQQAAAAAAAGGGAGAGSASTGGLYLNLVVPQSQERELLGFLDHLHDNAEQLGVADGDQGLLLSLTPLEEENEMLLTELAESLNITEADRLTFLLQVQQDAEVVHLKSFGAEDAPAAPAAPMHMPEVVAPVPVQQVVPVAMQHPHPFVARSVVVPSAIAIPTYQSPFQPASAPSSKSKKKGGFMAPPVAKPVIKKSKSAASTPSTPRSLQQKGSLKATDKRQQQHFVAAAVPHVVAAPAQQHYTLSAQQEWDRLTAREREIFEALLSMGVREEDPELNDVHRHLLKWYRLDLREKQIAAEINA